MALQREHESAHETAKPHVVEPAEQARTVNPALQQQANLQLEKELRQDPTSDAEKYNLAYQLLLGIQEDVKPAENAHDPGFFFEWQKAFYAARDVVVDHDTSKVGLLRDAVHRMLNAEAAMASVPNAGELKRVADKLGALFPR